MQLHLVYALGLLGSLPLVLAQSSFTAPPTTASSPANASATSSFATAVTNTVVSASSRPSSTTADVPRPTANITAGAEQSLRLWAPSAGLVMCETATFAFTGPSVPKTCGVFVTNTSTYIQQIPLSGAYTPLTAGLFEWLVDLPSGLSVNVQFWVTLNGAVQQFTLPPIVVQPNSDNSCLATGQGQNTQSIVAYASALNESPSATPTSSGSTANVGAIAGGVVGAVAVLCALVLLLYLLHRRRTRSPPPPMGEKDAYDPSTGGPTYAQLVAINYAGQQGGAAGVVPYQSAGPAPQPAAARPYAAEPMPASPASPLNGGHMRPPLSPPGTAATPAELGGTEGLDDPATFLSRSTASERGGRRTA
ncbi:hypothetical protein JCM3770_002045 [Rhodotorula araucariae]